MSNSKNDLQIYCQQKGLVLPVYTSIRDESGKWVSTVSFKSAIGISHTVSGDQCLRKKFADMSAASSGLRLLDEKEGERNVDTLIVKRVHTLLKCLKDFKYASMYVLVDYENVNKLTSLHNVFKNIDNKKIIQVNKFVGYSHHKIDTDEPSHSVESAGNDAVDHYISVFVGMIIMHTQQALSEDITILVVTKDIFGSHLESFAKSLPWLTIKHVPTERRCIEYLNTEGYFETCQRAIYND